MIEVNQRLTPDWHPRAPTRARPRCRVPGRRRRYI